MFNTLRKFFEFKGVRFLLVGGSAAATEYISFICIAYLLGITVLVANVVSFLIGFIVSFTLNRSWVFKSDGDRQKQILSYAALAMVNLVASTAIVSVLAHMMPAFIVKVFAMGCIAIWNYFIFSKYIFVQAKK